MSRRREPPAEKRSQRTNLYLHLDNVMLDARGFRSQYIFLPSCLMLDGEPASHGSAVNLTLTCTSFVLPAASFYSLNEALGSGPAAGVFALGLILPKRWMVIILQGFFASRSLMRELLEPYFSRIRFTKEQKKRWFRDRQGLLFGES
jgi:hypothetical protein